MKELKCVLMCIGFSLMVACTSPTVSMVGLEIDRYREGNMPEAEHSEVAVLTDEGTLGEQGEIESKMAVKGAKLGGDALIFQEPKKIGEELKGLGLADTYLYKAEVIRYKNEEDQ